jgi:hypothetical protein
MRPAWRQRHFPGQAQGLSRVVSESHFNDLTRRLEYAGFEVSHIVDAEIHDYRYAEVVGNDQLNHNRLTAGERLFRDEVEAQSVYRRLTQGTGDQQDCWCHLDSHEAISITVETHSKRLLRTRNAHRRSRCRADSAVEALSLVGSPARSSFQRLLAMAAVALEKSELDDALAISFSPCRHHPCVAFRLRGDLVERIQHNEPRDGIPHEPGLFHWQPPLPVRIREAARAMGTGALDEAVLSDANGAVFVAREYHPASGRCLEHDLIQRVSHRPRPAATESRTHPLP